MKRAVVVVAVAAACFSCTSLNTVEVVESDGATTSPPEPTSSMNPVEPLPLTFVWTPVDGVDPDSPPARIARAVEESFAYSSSHVGIDYGYEGFLEFLGKTPGEFGSPEETSALARTGTVRGAILSVSEVTGSAHQAVYSVDVCTSRSRASQLDRETEEWRRSSQAIASREYFATTDVIPTPWEGQSAPTDSSRRVPIPAGNVFEGWKFVSDERPDRALVPEERDRLQAQCESLFPIEHGPVSGPLPSEPFYPGWPAS